MLPSCSNRPNYVSSQSDSPKRAIIPYQTDDKVSKPLAVIAEFLQTLPEVREVHVTDDSLHAIFATLVLGFKDDFNLWHDKDEQLLHVRSASRLGYYDFGVNRKRVEYVRQLLLEQELIKN